jgi:hypothetical protein
MSVQITTAFVTEYKNNLELLLQQMGSRLRRAVTEGSYTSEGGSPVDQIGQRTAQKRTTRHGDSPVSNTPHDRRWVYPQDYEDGDFIDKQDLIRTFLQNNLTSGYTQAISAALGRAIDDEIISAFFGDSKTGKAGGTTTTFPADQQVAVNYGAAANTGLTVAKLREAKRLLTAAEVDLDADPLYCIITAKQHDDLLKEIQVISLDFNDRPVLMAGEVKQFLGFEFIRTERLLTDSNSYRRVPAFAKSGMHLGMWSDITARVTERADKSFSLYAYGSLTCGATRTQEKKVVEVKCSEA